MTMKQVVEQNNIIVQDSAYSTFKNKEMRVMRNTTQNFLDTSSDFNNTKLLRQKLHVQAHEIQRLREQILDMKANAHQLPKSITMLETEIKKVLQETETYARITKENESKVCTSIKLFMFYHLLLSVLLIIMFVLCYMHKPMVVTDNNMQNANRI